MIVEHRMYLSLAAVLVGLVLGLYVLGGRRGLIVCLALAAGSGVLTALRATEEHRALHGLARALVANAVHGVTSGFKKELDIVGVGYRAELKGKMVSFALGKSHPIEFPIPEGIQVAVEKQTHIVVSGADKGQVGQVAADMRSLRPPDPYKQKGVRITGERLKKKAGKAGAKAGAA